MSFWTSLLQRWGIPSGCQGFGGQVELRGLRRHCSASQCDGKCRSISVGHVPTPRYESWGKPWSQLVTTHQYPLIRGNKCSTLMQDISDRGHCLKEGDGTAVTVCTSCTTFCKPKMVLKTELLNHIDLNRDEPWHSSNSQGSIFGWGRKPQLYWWWLFHMLPSHSNGAKRLIT